MKKVLIVAVCLVFVLFLSLGIVAACVVRTGHDVRFAVCLDEKATREETHALDLAAGKALSVDLPAGTIHVTSSSDAAPSITATLTAYGDTQAEADRALSATKLDLQATTDGVSIRLLEPGKDEFFLGAKGSSARADVQIRLPRGVRLDLASGSGDIECEGAFAASTAHSSYGDVRIEGVEGDVEATSSSGDVRVARVRGKKVVAKSDYGSVQASDCESERVVARSSSGDVKLEGVRADRLEVGSGYGNVELLEVGGEIEARLSSGDVHLAGWTGAKATLSTDYGTVRVEKASGALEAKSSSGNVHVRGHEGALVARSNYGSVDVDGVFASLRADSSSGDVTARSRPGSRTDGPWELSSSYGNVKLLLPEKFSCDLDAETGYGEVEIGFPIEVQPGKVKRGSQSVRGKLNGGGGSVELRCTSGDVKVAPAGS